MTFIFFCLAYSIYVEMDFKRGWSRMGQPKFIDIDIRDSILSMLIKQVRVVLILYLAG